MAYNYGQDEYGSHAYGGADSVLPAFISQIPVIVEVYDNTLAYKGIYQSGAGPLLGVEFSHDESGCRDFQLYFADFVEIEKKYIIKIKLFGNDYFFTGVVRDIPVRGSSTTDFNYSGYGLNDYLVRANTESRNYNGDDIETIVYSLLNNVVTVKTPIAINYNKVDVNLGNITVTDITFKYDSCKDAFKRLKELAQSDGYEYQYGVDRFGDFFFMRRSEALQKTLVVGKQGEDGINEYDPVDSKEQRSKYFVLDKDGAYVTTVSSSEDIDVFEDKLTAPDIDTADIPNWANGILLGTEEVTRSAKIEWQIEKSDPLILVADGTIRILSNTFPDQYEEIVSYPFGSGLFGSGIFGGEQPPDYYIDDTLKVKKVSYIINNAQAIRKIALGSLPVRLDREMLKINQDLKLLRVSLGR